MSRSVALWLIASVALLAASACQQGPRVAYKELLDEDPLVRADAARRLGDARSAEAVESLVAVLDDPSEDVRVTALISLGKIKDTSVIPVLVELADDPLHTVRLQLSRTLGLIGDPRGVPALRKLLYDPDETVRISSCRSLAWIGSPDAIQTMVDVALLDENEAVRNVVLRTMGDLDVRDAIPLLERSLRGESDEVRAHAAEALRQLADASSVPVLLEALHDPYFKVRSIAAHTLGSMASEDPQVKQAIADRLAVEEHELTQVDLAWNLARCGDRSRLDVVRALLFRGREEDVRAEAAIALGDVGDNSDLALLDRALKDKNGLVRREAFNAYKKLKEAEA